MMSIVGAGGHVLDRPHRRHSHPSVASGGPESVVIAISNQEVVLSLIVTIIAALALAGVSVATHTTTSHAPAERRVQSR